MKGRGIGWLILGILVLAAMTAIEYDWHWGNEMMDNPGTFATTVGDDLYVNPWWALRKTSHPRAAAFVACMNRTLGPPDLWFHDPLFHELL